MMSYAPHRYITLDQLSKQLGGRSRSSLYRDIEAGRIPKPFKIGRRVYWNSDEISSAIEDMRR